MAIDAEHEHNKPPAPAHLGIILDGNRRWARENNLPQLEGHRRGYLNLKTIAEAAFNTGVKYVSAYVFSTENWRRSKEEVNYLMKLLYWVATEEVAEMKRKNIRVRFLGSSQRLSPKILRAIARAEAATITNTGGDLCLCLNYGGQTEIADGLSRMIQDGIAPAEVTPELISRYLYHPDVPAVDLVIRTSGEQRLSNFMLWRSAYAELWFMSRKHWPAFTPDDLAEALADYARRARRFGGDALKSPEPARASL